MSPIEIPILAGSAAPAPASVEQPDAELFAGLLDDQVQPTRGRLAFARRLQDQSDAVRRMQEGTDTLSEWGLVAGGAEQPLINPGPGGGAKAEQPLINPGMGGATKSEQPLVNPGPGQAKPEAPIVLPAGADAKPQGPQINPGPASAAGGAIQILAGDGQDRSVVALAQAAQQAVSQAPQTAPSTGRDPELETPDLASALEGADPEAAVSGAAPRAGAATPATPGGGIVPEVAAHGGRPQPDGTDLSTSDDLPMDRVAVDQEPLTAPAATDIATPAHSRADAAAIAGRQSFDALAQVSAQIIRRLEARTTRFDMELNPVELGRVDVRLDIDSEGRLAARLAFDNPAAALELRGRVDDLRRELQQAGFQLSDDAFSFTDRGGSDGRRGFDPEEARRAHARSTDAAEQIDAAAQPALRASLRLGLDVRV